jgi:hypothetical protein
VLANAAVGVAAGGVLVGLATLATLAGRIKAALPKAG